MRRNCLPYALALAALVLSQSASGACTDNTLNAASCTTAGGRYVTATAGADITGWSNALGTTSLTATIPDGFYSGKTITFTEANLLSHNIKDEVSIFGVTGGLNPSITIPAGAAYFVESRATTSGCIGVRSSTLTRVGTTATFNATSTSHHFFISGMSVTITGAAPAQYNGTFVITVTGNNTFTYTMASDPGSSATTQGDACPVGGGGLAAANAFCLNELTTNTNWKGYAQAFADGNLVIGKVKAFLCDSTTCNNLNPNTTYYFANGSDNSAGGSSFTTDASGYGPGDSFNWGKGGRFGGVITGVNGSPRPWTGRSTGAATLWNSTPDASTCTDWTATSGNGRGGTAFTTNNGRWSTGNATCNNMNGLICLVNP